MKKRIIVIAHVCVCLFVASISVYGNTNLVERTDLQSRSYKNWEGVYSFNKEVHVKIFGMENLSFFIYWLKGTEKSIITFVRDLADEGLELLIEASPNNEGITPYLEGIIVVPDSDGADIIISWRQPGNGGYRVLDKYRYSSKEIVLANRSMIEDINGEKQWISEDALQRWREEKFKGSSRQEDGGVESKAPIKIGGE